MGWPFYSESYGQEVTGSGVSEGVRSRSGRVASVQSMMRLACLSGEAHFDLDEALGAEQRIGNEGEGGSAAESEAVLASE
jgi:hypothetical protein